MTRLRYAPIGLALLALAACADQPKPPPQHHAAGGPPGGRLMRASLFVSPAGKPFRAAPGEPYPVGKWFAEADKDGDGKLTLAEFQADAEAFFHQLDKDGDGIVAGVEVTYYETILVPEISGRRAPGEEEDDGALVTRPEFLLAQFGGGGGGGMGGGMGGGGMGGGGRRHGGGGGGGNTAPHGDGSQPSGMGAAPYGLLGEPEPVTAADTDFNSLITLKEFREAAAKRFAILDAKGVGYLTLADLPKTPAQSGFGGRRGGRRGRPPQA